MTRRVPFSFNEQELDPNFVLAWAYLADAHSFYYRLGYDFTEARRVMAREAFDRALAGFLAGIA